MTLFAADAAAQRPALFGGFSFQGSEGSHAVGLQLGATLGMRATPGLSTRFDVAYTRHTPPTFVTVAALCPQPPQPCGFSRAPSGGDLAFYSATVDALYFDPKNTHRWGYWLAGLGLYAVARSPGDGSYARIGWNVGFGWRVSDATFVEARYHGIVHPAGLHGFLPIVFGVRL